MLHHESYFRSRGELSQYEAEIQGLNEERNALKLLGEQKKEKSRAFELSWLRLKKNRAN